MTRDGQPRELRAASLSFLRTRGQLFISTVVRSELESAPEPARTELRDLLNATQFEELVITEECALLALRYIDSKILPAKKREDALHVAAATVYNMDVLISCNHQHIPQVRTTQ